jgi:hypothetical protein
VLDTAMLTVVVLAVPGALWPIILAAEASTARITFAVRSLRPVLASCYSAG